MRLYYVVLVFLLYITLAKNTGKHTGKLDQVSSLMMFNYQIDTRYANLHETCKINDCKELGRYENMNCIHECIFFLLSLLFIGISEQCYSSIYRDEPVRILIFS